MGYLQEHPFTSADASSTALSVGMFLWCALISAVSFPLLYGFRNLYFHPLSSIPGPKLATFTELYYVYLYFSGKAHLKITGLHNRYGPVIRVGPNKLSFNTPRSYKDIYNSPPSRPPFLKSTFYEFDSGAKNMVNVRDPGQHAAWKRLLSSAFSHKSLAQQEPLVQRCVDQLIKQLWLNGTKPGGANIVLWFMNASFDIIGDMALGETFGSLDTGETHFWVKSLARGGNVGSYRGALVNYFGTSWVGRQIAERLLPRRNRKSRQEKMEFCREKVLRRTSSDIDRKDFFGNFKVNGEWIMPLFDLTAHSFAFVAAGSGTSSSFMSTTIFYLLQNPDVLKTVTDEVRSKFSDYESITNNNIMARAPFLRAVMSESFRIHPPVPLGLPRVSPGDTVDGFYVPAGVEVFTTNYAATHSPGNFLDAEKFVPERWLGSELYKDDKKEASVPFSLGTRSCIGVNLAMLENRLMLTKILWVFDLELVDPEDDWFGKSRSALMWSQPELFVRLTKREGIAVPPIGG